MYIQTTYQSKLGVIVILCDKKSVKGIWFKEQAYYGKGFDLESIPFGESNMTQKVKKWLDDYFSGKMPSLSGLNLAPEGTVYQQKVMKILQEVPYYQTITYQEIANQLMEKEPGYKTSARAVGGAIGRNPISILIPCHRVVGSNGSLTGYAGGIERKIELLVLEGFARNDLETFVIKKSSGKDG